MGIEQRPDLGLPRLRPDPDDVSRVILVTFTIRRADRISLLTSPFPRTKVGLKCDKIEVSVSPLMSHAFGAIRSAIEPYYDEGSTTALFTD